MGDVDGDRDKFQGKHEDIYSAFGNVPWMLEMTVGLLQQLVKRKTV